MNPRSVTLGLLVLLLLAGCRGGKDNREGESRESPAAAGSGGGARVESQAGVVLDSATERRIGLVLEPLRPSSRGTEIRLPGELIADPAGSSILRAPIAGKLVAAGHPWPSFGDSLVEGIEIAQVADARPLLVPRGGTVVKVMAQPGELVQAGQELLEIAEYNRPLARVAWRADAPATPPRVLRLSPLGSPEKEVSAHLVGPASEADPLTRREAWLYRAEVGWPGARPGNAIIALVPDPRGGRGEVLVPLGAVVQWESLAWVFVQHGRGHFVRTRVPTDHPTPGGWLVRDGVTARDTVVVRGAEQLLSEEFRARITVGEEVGE